MPLCDFPMKTKLIVMLVLLIPAGGAQAQPYLTASTGTAHIAATGYGSQTRRRDAVAIGQGLTDLIAVEVSYFQIQEARYPLPPPPGPTIIPAAVAVRQKLSGLVVGPVFRWNFFAGLMVYTRQSLAFSKTTLFTEQLNFSSGRSYRNGSYQPSVGLHFRPLKSIPFGAGLEWIYVAMSQAKITSTVLNVSYGF
jgi:hypothetical protein